MSDFFDVNQFLWHAYEQGGQSGSADVMALLECAAHLMIGKNLVLVGPPGTGKTRTAKRVWHLFCDSSPDSGREPVLVTGNAEWTAYDVLGGLTVSSSSPSRFRPGFLTEACKTCTESLERDGVPTFLLVDEINRANLDLAFGKVFTLLDVEHRSDPILGHWDLEGCENAAEYRELRMPETFRLIATMNSEDRALLFSLGYAFRRRFAFVDVPSPFDASLPAETTRDSTAAWTELLSTGEEWKSIAKEMESLWRVKAQLPPPRGLSGLQEESVAEFWDRVKDLHDQCTPEGFAFNPCSLAFEVGRQLAGYKILRLGYGQGVDVARYAIVRVALETLRGEEPRMEEAIPAACDQALCAYILPQLESFLPKLRRLVALGDLLETGKAEQSLRDLEETLRAFGLAGSARKVAGYRESMHTGELPA